MSQSRASWLLMGASLSGLPILALIRARRLGWPVKLVSVVTLVIAIGALSAFAFTKTVESLGRDETFSGRTELWYGASSVAVENHPFLGAGYRAFWTTRGGDGVRRFIDWGYLPDHGHNGYLDVWLELGVPGAALFAVFIVLTMGRLLKRAVWAPHERAWAAMIAFLVVFLLNNMSATVAFKHTDIAWAFAVLAALYAHNAPNAHSPAASIRRRRTAQRARQVFTPQPAGSSL